MLQRSTALIFMRMLFDLGRRAETAVSERKDRFNSLSSQYSLFGSLECALLQINVYSLQSQHLCHVEREFRKNTNKKG